VWASVSASFILFILFILSKMVVGLSLALGSGLSSVFRVVYPQMAQICADEGRGGLGEAALPWVLMVWYLSVVICVIRGWFDGLWFEFSVVSVFFNR